MLWTLRAVGEPVPKGSWNPIGCGRPLVGPGGERYYRIRDIRLKAQESNRLKMWKHAVELAICDAGRPRRPHEGPVELGLTFYLHEPKKSKFDYPARCDLDKLIRAVGDFLTGVYYVDDKQIVAFVPAPRKVFASEAEPEGAEIVIKTQGATELPGVDFDEAREVLG